MTIDSETFKAGMRQLAAGVTVVTSALNGERSGLTATSVCSVSADPPTLLVCVNRHSRSNTMIAASGCFAVNVLGTDDEALSNRFASSSESEERFRGHRWLALESGAPILEDALAAFDCRVVQQIEEGSHTIFIGSVVAARKGDGQAAPLLYMRGGYGSFSAE